MKPYRIRGRSGYYVKYKDPLNPKRRIQVRKGTKPEALAEIARRKTEAELIKSGAATAADIKIGRHSKVPVDELLDQWKQSMDDNRLSSSHIKRYYAYARRVLRDELPGGSKAGHKTCQVLSDVDASTVGRYLGRLLAPPLSRSVNTRNEYLVAVKAFLLWCVETGILRESPLKSLHKLDQRKDPRRPRRSLTDDEFGRLLEAARLQSHSQLRGRGARWYVAFYLVSGRCGGRWTEIAKLQWHHVDFDNNRIHFASELTKTGESGYVDMLPLVRDALQDLRNPVPGPSKRGRPRKIVEPTASDLVFGGTPTRRTFVRHLKSAGVLYMDERGRVASLRKTLASQLVAAGTPPRTLQLIMRHKSIETTFRHYSDPDMVDTAGALLKLS